MRTWDNWVVETQSRTYYIAICGSLVKSSKIPPGCTKLTTFMCSVGRGGDGATTAVASLFS